MQLPNILWLFCKYVLKYYLYFLICGVLGVRLLTIFPFRLFKRHLTSHRLLPPKFEIHLDDTKKMNQIANATQNITCVGEK